MNMRMKFELLAPGVQDTEEADLCPKVSRIARHFEEGFRTGTKQKIIEDLLVLQDQWRQATGQGEHDMGVGRREEFSPTRRDPPFPSGSLTLRAMADRKSTRLNSSHRTISYAVFCLKKKKNSVLNKDALVPTELRGHKPGAGNGDRTRYQQLGRL